MNLYRITQDFNQSSYSHYDAAIVAAETEEQARNFHPDGSDTKFPAPSDWEDCSKKDNSNYYRYRDWVPDSSMVKADLIGIAKEGTKAGVVLASLNSRE